MRIAFITCALVALTGCQSSSSGKPVVVNQKPTSVTPQVGAQPAQQGAVPQGGVQPVGAQVGATGAGPDGDLGAQGAVVPVTDATEERGVAASLSIQQWDGTGVTGNDAWNATAN